jgi:uncharacterized surface anchored protein
VKADADKQTKNLEKAKYGLYWAGGLLGGYHVDADTLLQEFVTDKDGLILTAGNITEDTLAETARLNSRQKMLLKQGLVPGNYYFREEEAPFCYVKSDTKYAFSVTEESDGKVLLLGESGDASFVKESLIPAEDGQQTEAAVRKAAEEKKIKVTDRRLPGHIGLDKVRKDHITEHVGGAEYTIFTDKACRDADKATKEKNAFDVEKDFAAAVRTGEDGLADFTNLKWGTYFIKETKSAPGYQIDPFVYEVIVGPNNYRETAEMSALSEQNGHVLSTWTGEDAVHTYITVQDYANTLTIRKMAQIFASQAKEESETKAQGGAVFRIRLLDKDFQPTVSTTQELSTDEEDGEILWERQQIGLVQGYAYQLEEVEAPEGYMRIAPIRFMVFDDYGTIQLLDENNRPADEVAITDAEGVVRDGTSLVARVEKKEKTDRGSGPQGPGSPSASGALEEQEKDETTLSDFTIVVTNPQQDNRIRLIKTDRYYGGPVKGAEYQLFESSEDLDTEAANGSLKADDSRLVPVTDAEGSRLVQETDENGKAEFTHLSPAKYYYVTETKAAKGYRLDAAIHPVGSFRTGAVQEATYHGETKEVMLSDMPISDLGFRKVLRSNEDEEHPKDLPLAGVRFAFFTDEEAKEPYLLAQTSGDAGTADGNTGSGAADGRDYEADCVVPEDQNWTGGLVNNSLGAKAEAVTGEDGSVHIQGLPHRVLYMKEIPEEAQERGIIRENQTVYRVDMTGNEPVISTVQEEPEDEKSIRITEEDGKKTTEIVNRYNYGSVSLVKLDREDYLGEPRNEDGEKKEPKMTAIAGSRYGLFRRADSILAGGQSLKAVADGKTETAQNRGTQNGGTQNSDAQNSGTQTSENDDLTENGIWVQVDEAVTNSYGRVTFDHLIPGYSYKIQETGAPAGYRKSKAAFYFATSVQKEDTSGMAVVAVTPETGAPSDAADKDTAASDQTLAKAENGDFLMRGDSYVWLEPQIMLRFRKVDPQDNDLAGAEFQIRDENGNMIAAWVSGNEPKILSGAETAAMEVGKTYWLHEVKAPDGYVAAEPISFVVRDKRVGGQEQYVQEIEKVVNVTCTPTPTPRPTTKPGGNTPGTQPKDPDHTDGRGSDGNTPGGKTPGTSDDTPEGSGNKPQNPMTREEIERTIDTDELPQVDRVPEGGYEVETGNGRYVVFDKDGRAIGLRTPVQTGDSATIVRDLCILLAFGLLLWLLLIKRRKLRRE